MNEAETRAELIDPKLKLAVGAWKKALKLICDTNVVKLEYGNDKNVVTIL